MSRTSYWFTMEHGNPDQPISRSSTQIRLPLVVPHEIFQENYMSALSFRLQFIFLGKCNEASFDNYLAGIGFPFSHICII